MGGRSGEFMAMDESLTKQYYVKEEGLRIVNFYVYVEILTLKKSRLTMCQQSR